MPRVKTDPKQYKTTLVRLPLDLFEYIREEADAAGRPVTTQLQWMLDYLRRHPVDLKPPPRHKPQPVEVL